MIDEQWYAYLKSLYNKTITELNVGFMVYKFKKPLHVEVVYDEDKGVFTEYYVRCPELGIDKKNYSLSDANTKIHQEIEDLVRKRFWIKRDYENMLRMRELVDFDASHPEYEDEPVRRCESCDEAIDEFASQLNNGKCPWCGDILLVKG